MTGSKGTHVGIRVTQACTVAAVSAFFDHRRRHVTGLITHKYPRLRCLRCLHCLRLLVGPMASHCSVCNPKVTNDGIALECDKCYLRKYGQLVTTLSDTTVNSSHHFTV